MKFAWRNTIPNLAAWNTNDVEEINDTIIGEYKTLLSDDNWQEDFDNNLQGSVGVIE
jgi:hypothetical protein